MNQLILVGCKDKKSCPRIITSASFFGNQAIPHWHLASCQSHLDWILSALSGQTLLHRTFETTLSQQADNNDLFSIRFYDQQELARLSSAIQNSKLKTHHSKLKTHTGKQVLASIKSALDWRYPFGDAPRLPAKRSVTQWTHRNDEFVRLDYSRSLDRKPKTILDVEQINGLNIGSAVHLVISLLDLVKPITTEAIEQLIIKLIEDGSITQTVAVQVNVESIIKFFETDLSQMMLDKNNVVWREWPFTTAIPASQWSESESQNATRSTQDYIIVQGIIDLLIKTPKGLVIVDYKTDNVSANEAPPRAELYRRQLDLYAQAAEAIIGIKVHSKWLYFLTPGCKIEV
jgi:ATP-dependent helicase/nuclease subunit A